MNKVLIVEDDQLLIKMYKTKFESEGFIVLTAEDGELGLKVARTEGPDIILLDIMMPKMSGEEVLIELQKDLKTKGIPVIIFSNLSQEDQEQKLIQLGAKEYMVKANYTPGEVVLKVKQYLQLV